MLQHTDQIDPAPPRKSGYAVLIAAMPCTWALLTGAVLTTNLAIDNSVLDDGVLIAGICVLASVTGVMIFFTLQRRDGTLPNHHNEHLRPQKRSRTMTSDTGLPVALSQFLTEHAGQPTPSSSLTSTKRKQQRDSISTNARLSRELQLARAQIAAVTDQQHTQQISQQRLRTYLLNLTSATLARYRHQDTSPNETTPTPLSSLLENIETYIKTLQLMGNQPAAPGSQLLPETTSGTPTQGYIALIPLIDRVIAQSTVATNPDANLLPLFSGNCNVRLLEQDNQITRHLLHYLLAWRSSLDTQDRPSTHLYITVSDSNLCCSLKPLPDLRVRRQMHQCAQLLAINDLAPDSLMMRLAISPGLPPPASWAKCRRGFIANGNTAQRASLTSRLAQIGVTCTEHAPDADCLLLLGEPDGPTLRTLNLPQDSRPVLQISSGKIARDPYIESVAAPLQHNALLDWLGRVFPAPDTEPVILIADDDKGSRRLLSSLLQACNCRVIEAENGLEAIHTSEHHAIDLVLMDIHMPVMGGLEACRQLQTRCRAPIIAMTAHIEQGLQRAALEAGFDDVLVKPVGEHQLHRYLPHWLNDSVEMALPATASAPSTPPVFDHDKALRIANHRPELAQEMLVLFMANLPQDRQQLTEGFAAGLHTQIADSLHRLRGACRYSGATRLQHALDAWPQDTAASMAPATALARIDAEIEALQRWHRINPAPFNS